MSITERIAYIKGLAEGLQLDQETKEGKLISAMLDALEDIAYELADMTERVDMIDCDLADVEDYIDDLDSIFADDNFDDDFDDDWTDEEDEEDDDGVYEFECPNCHETIFFDESIFDDDEDFELECPACGAKLDSLFDFEDGDDPEED